MANFEKKYNGSKVKFGNYDMNMYVRIHGSNNTSNRTLSYYVTIGVYYKYNTAFTWNTATSLKIDGSEKLNNTALKYHQSGGNYDLKTFGPYTKSYNDSGSAGSVKVSGRLYKTHVKNNTTGKYYNLDTKLSEQTYTFPTIGAVSKPSTPSGQLINGVVTAYVNERTDGVRLSWNHADGGYYGRSGYKVYYSVGSGWQHIGTTTNNYFDTSIASCYNSLGRGNYVGFQVTTYNNKYESGKAANANSNNALYLNGMSASSSIGASYLNSASINWSSNLNTQKVEWRLNSTGNWNTASSGINTKSGSFSISGLRSGSSYTVNVRLTAKSDGTLSYSNVALNTKAMTIGVSHQDITPIQARINWSSNAAVSTVEWKLSTESNWRTAQSNLNATSGNFNATGLPYNTSLTVQVRLTARADGVQVSSSTGFKTLDIARLTKYPTEWSVEDNATVTITNPGNCVMQLFIKYNGVEVISRNNIKLNNGTYTISLSTEEKNMLYVQASSDSNPSFQFILKSYISTKIGEDTKNTKITFPTKAWTKINNSWKRALVWGKVNSSWKQCIPWVKIGSTWKII